MSYTPNRGQPQVAPEPDATDPPGRCAMYVQEEALDLTHDGRRQTVVLSKTIWMLEGGSLTLSSTIGPLTLTLVLQPPSMR